MIQDRSIACEIKNKIKKIRNEQAYVHIIKLVYATKIMHT